MMIIAGRNFWLKFSTILTCASHKKCFTEKSRSKTGTCTGFCRGSDLFSVLAPPIEFGRWHSPQVAPAAPPAPRVHSSSCTRGCQENRGNTERRARAQTARSLHVFGYKDWVLRSWILLDFHDLEGSRRRSNTVIPK